MEPNIYTYIGKKIRGYRIRFGLTQEELADKANIHYSFLGHIERGSKKASLDTVDKIAKALGINIDKLFESVSPVKTKKSKLSNQIEFLLKDHSPKYQKFIVGVVKKLTKELNIKT